MLQIPGDASAQPQQRLLLVQPGVYHEQRDRRLHLEVKLPFTVYVDGKLLKGLHFSLDRIVTQRQGYDGWTGKPIEVPADMFDGGEVTMGLHIQLSGFALELDVVATPDKDRPRQGDALTFRILRMDAEARDALKRIMRAYQAGHLPTSEDFVSAANGETGVAGQGGSQKGAEAAPRRWPHYAAFAGSALALLAVMTLSAASLYQRFFVVRSEFAAVTVPQIELLSPEQGQVEVVAGAVGARVAVDQPIYTVHSETIDSQLNLTKSRIAVLEQQAAKGFVSAEGVPAADGLALETAEMKALELRKQSLSAHAPCDCMVVWSLEDKAWAKQGDRIMMLARTDAADVRVEAAVKLQEAKGLHVGQAARFRAPDGGAFLPAHVERITLDADRQPRFGFPDWLRREPTVASVILVADGPVDAGWIGQPIEVVFSSGGGSLLETGPFALAFGK